MTNSDKPVRYFKTVSCVYLTCHSLTGKKLIFCFRRVRRNTHGIWNSLLLDRNLIYISFSQVLELWLGYEYCLDARGVTHFYAGGIVSSESSFLGSDYGKAKKECPFCMWSETYFQEDYFLDRT